MTGREFNLPPTMVPSRRAKKQGWWTLGRFLRFCGTSLSRIKELEHPQWDHSSQFEECRNDEIQRRSMDVVVEVSSCLRGGHRSNERTTKTLVLTDLLICNARAKASTPIAHACTQENVSWRKEF